MGRFPLALEAVGPRLRGIRPIRPIGLIGNTMERGKSMSDKNLDKAEAAGERMVSIPWRLGRELLGDLGNARMKAPTAKYRESVDRRRNELAAALEAAEPPTRGGA
jgi:hypothetical protein